MHQIRHVISLSLLLILSPADVTGDNRQLAAQDASFKASAAAKSFADWDVNRDGMLSLDEWLAGQPEDKQVQLKRDFQVVDWDGDGALSLSEWTGISSMVPVIQRDAIPDPVTDLAQEQLERIRQSWKQWDTDEDGALNATEFANSTLTSTIPGLQEVAFPAWDFDQSGQVDRDEVRRVIEAAYGIRNLNGFQLRQSNGLVFDALRFREADRDQDGFIGIADWQQSRNISSTQATAELQRHDQNGDGRLSPDEALALMARNSLQLFLSLDTDFDGLISTAELLSGTPEVPKTQVGQILAGFDRDGDGRLNFREYRLSPLASDDLSWIVSRVDTNRDGLLSWGEFRVGDGIESAAISALMFAGFDLSGDGELNLQEFSFRGSPRGRTPSLLFATRDANRDGNVTLEELLIREIPARHSRLRQEFRVADWNGDGVLSEQEFTKLPSLITVAQRGQVPDPVHAAAQAQLERIAQAWPHWDKDRDQKLNGKEFVAAKLRTSIPGLAGTKFAEWDENGDANLDLQEVTRIVEAAYGIRQLTGFLPRHPNGMIFDHRRFRLYDRNKNGFITASEWRRRRNITLEKAIAEIAKYDTDKDGQLSAEESWPVMELDLLKLFLAADRDLDGLLSPEELLAATPSSLKPIARFVFPGFDRDQDGRLSFLEYRLSPVTNFPIRSYAEWDDLDANGLLSQEEIGGQFQIESAALMTMMFTGFDLSQDKQLDLGELRFRTAYRNPRQEFDLADGNRDGVLDLQEFAVFNSNPAVTKRDLQVFDRDGDQRLSFQEYLAIPSRTTLFQRISSPDPIVELAEGVLSQLQTAFSSADQDGNGSLNQNEFRSGRVASLLPGLQLTAFTEWDRDGDRKLTPIELQQVVEAAYGIRRFDGLPYREPSGITYRVWSYDQTDKNHDDQISQEEFLKSGIGGKTAAEAFQKADTNRDGFLSYAEWITTSEAFVDPIEDFLRADQDLNGKLSQQELASSVPKDLRWMALLIHAAFDSDNDGELSLKEYRQTPIANRLASWTSRPTDRDRDGTITLAEYCPLNGIPFAALSQEFFSRFDRDHNGKLNTQEMNFQIDLLKAPADIAFQFYDSDQDSFLSLDELLAEYAGRKGKSIERTIGRREEMFLASDRNSDKRLSLGEFQEGRLLLDTKAPQSKINQLSAQVSRNPQAAEPVSYRFWGMVAVNVLLVAGVGLYVLKR